MTEILEPVASTKPTADSRTETAPSSAASRQTTSNDKKIALRSGPLVELSDKDLVLKTVAGDQDAYGELVNRYQHEVRSLARAIVKSHQNAEDLAQEAFIKAFHSLPDLKEPEKFGGWICTILRHTALDFLRASKNMTSLEALQDEGFEPELETQEQGAITLEAHEDEMKTLQALINLREDYREIIVLKHVEKLSYKEIGKRLNMSVSAVGEKLSRVRTLLKRRLEKLPVKVPGENAKSNGRKSDGSKR